MIFRGYKNYSLTLLFIFIGISSVIVGPLLFIFYTEITTPLSPQGNQAIIEIRRGSNSKTISSLLQQKGLIKYSWTFNILAIIKDTGKKLKAGEYLLGPGMSPDQILNKIVKGQVIQHPITIPEGFNLNEIGDLLEKHHVTKKKSFIAAAIDSKVIKSFGLSTHSLEGYLFPETYYFEKDITDYDILKKFTDTFKEKIMTPKFMSKVENSNLSFHEIITLASLIEKETAKEEERALISAVFHNRLKKNMLLQCDPTVIYALKNFDGNIRKKDLKIDSPYNTYRYRGLPPGPISNPGLSSIETALRPAKANFLYFVSKKNGEHKFSTTLKEHNLAVKEYQLRRKYRK